MAASMSPSASPRLPSPPPIAEDQIGPNSPSPHKKSGDGQLGGSIIDDGATRRIIPGTKSKDMPEGPPLVPISEV